MRQVSIHLKGISVAVWTIISGIIHTGTRDESTPAGSYTKTNTSNPPMASLEGIEPYKFLQRWYRVLIQLIGFRKGKMKILISPGLPWLAFNEAHSPMHVPDADTLDAVSPR